MSVGIYQDIVRPLLYVHTNVPSINTTCTVNNGLSYILDPFTVTMLCMYAAKPPYGSTFHKDSLFIAICLVDTDVFTFTVTVLGTTVNWLYWQK